MILKVEDNKYILVEIFSESNPQIEQEFVEMNPEYVYEEEMPYSVSGVYIKDENGDYIPDEASELDAMKREKMDEILTKFDDMLNYGTFMSSLGFEVDNRRGNGKDDKDNVSSLIDLGQEPVYFRDHNNEFHALSMDDLRTLRQEMIQDGLSKYQWKWNKEQEVMGAETIEALLQIVI